MEPTFENDMKLDELITHLIKIKEQYGNITVVGAIKMEALVSEPMYDINGDDSGEYVCVLHR